DARNRAVAAVHAGWRGTAASIAAKTVAQMAEAFGSRPGDIEVAIGPGIGVCCYEVGAEVAAQFGVEGQAMIDLPEIMRRQLVEARLPEGNVFRGAPSPFCTPELLESFRRDKHLSGRMLSAIRIRR